MSSQTQENRTDDAPGSYDLDDPVLYLNREATWLAFNRRVLTMAEDADNPLLERLKFLAIFDSNLDEFFMKRVGGLKQQVGAGLDALSVDGRTPKQQLAECATLVHEALGDRACVTRELLRELADNDVTIRSYDSLDQTTRDMIRRQFRQHILPLITPLAIDEAHPFPFVSNLSINLLLEVRDPAEDEPHLVRVKVPVSDDSPRFVRIGMTDEFVPNEEIIAGNLDLLLPGAKILSVGVFRVTRNAIVERDEESANDLLELIESELRDRRFAPVVRVEVSPSLKPELREYLAEQLQLSASKDVYEVNDLLGLADLMQIASVERPELKFRPFEPAQHPRLAGARSIFQELDDNGPLLLKHPYQSFDFSVTRLLREAARDPSVLAIKTTVYRTSVDSEFVPLLVEAVNAGKQVAVVVELQARFDEAANITWANKLEEEGIHVAYGVVGYKTHSKALLIIRKHPTDGLRRYVHLGTGNYHSITARQYSDIGLMISDPVIGADTTELFNLLTSGSLTGRQYDRLLVAPNNMKNALLEKIEREMQAHRTDGEGLIQLKTNALEDADITRALYCATRIGVKVDLIVRDSCRFRPKIPGLSESGRVISILGRFLEHARVYYFRNGGDEEYFIGSADLMSRNLESRVETLVPITDEALQQELRRFLDLQLGDRRGAWEMDANGSYVKLSAGPDDRHSQTALLESPVSE